MTKEEGLGIIEKALNIANSRGCFNLTDSSSIYNAINVLTTHINYYNSLELINHGEGVVSKSLYDKLFSIGTESNIEDKSKLTKTK